MARVISRNPDAIMAAADGDGRWVVRTAERGMVNFFLVDDVLEAKVSDTLAEKFAQVYGFEVEGYPVKEDGFQPKSADFFADGDRLYQEREFGQQKKEKESNLAEQLVALLGADRVAAMFAEAVKAQAPQAETVAVREVASTVAKKAKAEKTRAWVLKDVMKFSEDQIKDLLDEFASDVDSAPMHRSAAAAALVKRANVNPNLDHKLRALTGR
jgi:hypothetical protein